MFNDKSYNLKMDKTIEVFTKELSTLRTGRANSAMLDLVKVDVYGQQMPINQVGSITTPEPRMINIQVLKKMIKSMGEKCKVSIRNVRREANEELKKLLKSKEIGEDEEKSFEKNVQTLTDKHISIVDEKVSSKEKEIMTI